MQTTDNHHHNEDNAMALLRNAISSVIESPQSVNTQIGRTMQHIGDTLVIASANYLPVHKSEILIEPKQFSGNTGLLLLNRQTQTNDSFLVIAYRSDDIIECTCVSPDRYNLTKSAFVELTPVLRTEMLRQLDQLFSQRTGSMQMVVCAVIINNFFGDAAAPEAAPAQQPQSVTDIVKEARVNYDEGRLPTPRDMD